MKGGPNSPKVENKKGKEKNDADKSVRTEEERNQKEAQGAKELKEAAKQQAHQNAEAFENLIEQGRELLERLHEEKAQLEEMINQSPRQLTNKLNTLETTLQGAFEHLDQRIREMENSQSAHGSSLETLKTEWKDVEDDIKTTQDVVDVLDQIQGKLKNAQTNPKIYKKVFLSIPGWMLISTIGGLITTTALSITLIVIASSKDEETINNIIVQRDELEDQEPKTEQEKKERDEKIKVLNEKIRAKKQEAIINQNDEEVWTNMSQCIKEEEEPPFEQIQALQSLQYLAKPSTVIWKNESKEKFDLAKSVVHFYNESEEMIWPDIYEYGYRNLNYNGEKIPRKDLAEIFQIATALYILQVKKEASKETKVEVLASV